MIDNCGDWDLPSRLWPLRRAGCTYRYTWDRNWRLLETRNGSSQTLKQHVWGPRYVDEIVQIAVNTDPSADSNCEALCYPLQNANFNVLGLADANGVLVERYEYTPYGQRTVYKKAGTNDALTSAPLDHSQRVEGASGTQPYTLCDLGHQGLRRDKEFGMYDVRTRPWPPLLARWPVRDHQGGHVDGMSLYEYVRSRPTRFVDSLGEAATDTTQPIGPQPVPDWEADDLWPDDRVKDHWLQDTWPLEQAYFVYEDPGRDLARLKALQAELAKAKHVTVVWDVSSPVAPWVNQDLSGQGQVGRTAATMKARRYGERKKLSFTCVCVRGLWIAKAHFDIDAEIHLDLKGVYDHFKELPKSLARSGSYGHEQRHLLQTFLVYAQGLADMEKVYSKTRWKTQPDCEAKAASPHLDLLSALLDDTEAGGRHVPPHPRNGKL